jgi:hypothetical protein
MHEIEFVFFRELFFLFLFFLSFFFFSLVLFLFFFFSLFFSFLSFSFRFFLWLSSSRVSHFQNREYLQAVEYSVQWHQQELQAARAARDGGVQGLPDCTESLALVVFRRNEFDAEWLSGRRESGMRLD